MEGLPEVRDGSMTISESSGQGDGLEDGGPEPKLKEDILRQWESLVERVEQYILNPAFYTFG
jgi:hypothetical protein